MQSTFLYCDKEQGTVEVTFSKREMAIENCVICADYKRIGNDLYEINFYYGLKNLDIMESLANVRWNVEYSNIRGCVLDFVKERMESKELRTQLRKKMRGMREKASLIYDTSWKLIKFYPTAEEVGYEDIEISAEYNDEKVDFYVRSKNGNKVFMRTFDFEREIFDTDSKVNEIVKDQLIKENLLSEFIFNNLDKLDMLE